MPTLGEYDWETIANKNMFNFLVKNRTRNKQVRLNVVISKLQYVYVQNEKLYIQDCWIKNTNKVLPVRASVKQLPSQNIM
jgi:hypothetical protein